MTLLFRTKSRYYCCDRSVVEVENTRGQLVEITDKITKKCGKWGYDGLSSKTLREIADHLDDRTDTDQ